jgi:hypothetical protein
MHWASEMSVPTRQAPNTRVQRTRSSPSALRSPLTRHPLGGMWLKEDADGT